MSYYDETAKGYNELHEEEQLNKLRIIKAELKPSKNAKLLDVGCGTGLSQKVFNCQIQGIDPSEELLKQCSFKTIKASAEKIPFNDKEFDFVIAVTCIHNFKNIEQGLKEIKRVGKKFALSILKKSPKYNNILNLIKEIFKINKTIDEDKDTIFICE